MGSRVRKYLMFVTVSVSCLFAAIASAQQKKPELRPTQFDQRIVNHGKAYLPRPELGQYLGIKVTPPEKRGQKRRVAVEVYNFSKVFISVADFFITLHNRGGMNVDSHVTAEDLNPGWGSAIKWIVIPGTGEIPPIESVEIKGMNIFTVNSKQLPLKYSVDLIKE